MSLEPTLQLAAVLRDLSAAWTPHPKQRVILNSVFQKLVPLTVIESGRKFGKSEIECYILWRWALCRPGQYYYFAPFSKQAREIIWASQRLQTFGPKHYISKISDQEMRITFTNGSFIKLDGTENYEAYRGVNPHGIVLDEFKDHRPEFWTAMEPNLATHSAQCVWAGTPPEVDQPFVDGLIAEAKRTGGYFNFTSYDNPHISPVWLDKKREELARKDESAIFEREYMARRVRGGPSAIIPMFDRKKHLKPYDEVMTEVKRDASSLEWIVTCDPGTASVFAVLLSAYNPYIKKLYHLDTLYIEKQADTSVSHVIPRIQVMRMDYRYEQDWLQVYDEAASWFANEAAATYDEHFTPTCKAQNKKDNGLSLIKGQLLDCRVVLTDRCEKLAWEVENYVKDKLGKIPKVNDHLIDCWRYCNAAINFDLMDDDSKFAEAEMYIEKLPKRGYTIEDDMEHDKVDKFDPYNTIEVMEEWR